MADTKTSESRPDAPEEQFFCEPCRSEGLQKAANNFCESCHEYICLDCKKQHVKFKVTRGHKITDIAESQGPEEFSDTKLCDATSSWSICEKHTVPSADKVNPMTTAGSMPAIPSEERKLDNILLLEVKSSRIAKIRLPNDKEEPSSPRVHGCVFLSSGELLMADDINQKLKLMDRDFNLKDDISFEREIPSDVAVLDDRNVIVTVRGGMQYVRVYPSFQFSKFIDVDKPCWGIAIADDKIYISCHDNFFDDRDLKSAEIRVFHIQGNEVKRLGENRGLQKPGNLAVNKDGSVVYVSDGPRNIVIALSYSDEILFQYRAEDLQFSTGLYVDSVDNILACGLFTQNVQVITAKGKKCKELLKIPSYDREYGWARPQSITFRPYDGTFVIGCESNDYLLIYNFA